MNVRSSSAQLVKEAIGKVKLSPRSLWSSSDLAHIAAPQVGSAAGFPLEKLVAPIFTYQFFAELLIDIHRQSEDWTIVRTKMGHMSQLLSWQQVAQLDLKGKQLLDISLLRHPLAGGRWPMEAVALTWLEQWMQSQRSHKLRGLSSLEKDSKGNGSTWNGFHRVPQGYISYSTSHGQTMSNGLMVRRPCLSALDSRLMLCRLLGYEDLTGRSRIQKHSRMPWMATNSATSPSTFCDWESPTILGWDVLRWKSIQASRISLHYIAPACMTHVVYQETLWHA